MKQPRKPRPEDAVVRRAQAHPGRDDIHEQRVPDQAAEGVTERESDSTRQRRPPNVDEAGGR